MTGKQIGKIRKASFGMGGYRDAMIGFSFELGSDKESWGIHDFKGYWSGDRSASTKWSEDDRVNYLGQACMNMAKIMGEAKCSTLQGLVGKPVEVTIEGNTLKEWRILTEAI